MTANFKEHIERVDRWARWPIGLLLLVSIAVALIPMSPGMPGPGLDASWVYGLGEAVARQFVFGKDLVFTFGPYASIYTSSYHPATYHYVLFGSACMALGFAILLLHLLAGRSLVFSLLVIFFLSCNAGAPDATLLVYPLLLSLFVYRLTLPVGATDRLDVRAGRGRDLIVSLVFGVLGLLPLIKGSMLILAIAAGGLSIARLYLTGNVRLAVVAAASSVICVLLFWLVAGQQILGLPSYFLNMLPIASGYTEAMSVKGKSSQILIYLTPWILSVVAIAMEKSLGWRNKFYLLAAFGLFLFMAFKAGFVRQDAHVSISGGSLFLAGVSLCMVLRNHWRWPALLLSVAAWFSICNPYYPITISSMATQARNAYSRLSSGTWGALTGTRDLHAAFEEARDRLRHEHPIPALRGTADIYPFDQSYLLASDNTWSSRPVFQSYSAYTPHLAELNRLHLTGPAAPDNIVFSLQPIDMRLPALDDGPSWPALMGLYKPVRYQDGFIYLEKRGGGAHVLDTKPLLEEEHGLRDTVAVPDTRSPLFVRIQMRRTFLGRLQGILFKPEELRITINLQDGSTRIYRFIPGMGEAGFVLSPLVENTSDFLLSYGSWKFLENKRVTSIKIWTKSTHPTSWADYKLTLSELTGREPVDIGQLVKVMEPTKIADEGQPLKEADCFGSIDSINGSSPAQNIVSYSPMLSIQGWIAESQTNPGDDSFAATLTTEAGATYVAPLIRSKRPDVATYFKSDVLQDSGYQAFIDAGSLGSSINVGIARKISGNWVACTHYHYPVILKARGD